MIDAILTSVMRAVEGMVEALAGIAYNVINTTPIAKELTEEEKRALAYAVVGDVIASPIPSPLDAPIDAVVDEKIRRYVDIGKYRRVAVRAAEAVPVLELLPNYTISVLAAIRERRS